MGTALKSKRIAFLAAGEGTERSELRQPWQTVLDEGGTAVLVSPAKDWIRLFEHLDGAETMRVDVPLDEASVDDFDALVLPGGVANPDRLRTDQRAVAFAKAFFTGGKPVAAICHAPWTLIEADEVRDRTLTSWPSLHTDLSNAGATWVDEPVSVCTGGNNTLVTSRMPDDLPVFCETLVNVFAGR